MSFAIEPRGMRQGLAKALGGGGGYARALKALILRFGAAGVAFTLNVAMARVLGPPALGEWYVGITVASVVSTVGLFGLAMYAMREVARLRVVRPDAVGRTVRRLLRVAIVLTTAFVVFTALSGRFTARLFNLDYTTLLIYAVCAVPLTIVVMHAESLKGLGRPLSGIAVHALLVPLAALVISLPLIAGGWLSVAPAYLWAVIGAAAGSLFVWRRSIENPSVLKEVQNRWSGGVGWGEMLGSGSRLLTVGVGGLIIQWSDLLMLGAMAPKAATGLYGLAVKITSVIPLVLGAVSAVVISEMGSLAALGRMAELRRLVRRTAAICTAAAAPLVLAFLIAGDVILGLVGKDFAGATGILSILAVGYFVHVAVGPVGYVLVVLDREAVVQRIVFGAALANLTLNVVLIPRFAGFGAAVATAVTLALMNGLLTLCAARTLTRGLTAV